MPNHTGSKTPSNFPHDGNLFSRMLDAMSVQELTDALNSAVENMSEEYYDPDLIDAYLDALEQKDPMPDFPDAEASYACFLEKLKKSENSKILWRSDVIMKIMNIIKSAKKYRAAIIALILTAALGAAFAVSQFAAPGSAEFTTDKEIVNLGYGCWPYYSFNFAAKDAVTIVYGKVLEKGEMKGSSAIEYETDVTVKVIQCLKGDSSSKEINFLEAGGETDVKYYLWDGITPVQIGEKYIFFLTKKGAMLNPATVIHVSNGKVDKNHALLPDTGSLSEDNAPDFIPVKDYMNAIRQQVEKWAKWES